jgi:AhpD family alkylhydroperoxidase
VSDDTNPTGHPMNTQRFDYYRHAPDATRALVAVSRAAHEHLPSPLLHLVSLRASQMNGCAYCVDLHYRDALAAGVPARTVNAVSAWRDAPFFTERERAAFAWTEALTRLDRAGVTEEAWEGVRAQFSEGEIACLTFAVAGINAWNRMSVSARKGPVPDD